MKLLAIFLVGSLALASSTASVLHHHHTPSQVEDIVQDYKNEHHMQHTSNFDFHQNQNGEDFINQHYDNQDHFNEMGTNNYNQQNNQGQNYEYNESTWNVQSRNLNNKNSHQNGHTRQNYQENSEALGQLYSNNKNQRNQNSELFSNYDSQTSSSFSSNSLEDYVGNQNEDDVANQVGRNVARKMVQFYSIIEKYATQNGIINTNQVRDPLPLRQFTLPMANHQFLNMNDTKVDGLSQGILKSMYANNEKNIVNLEYYFNNLLVNGYLKASTGSKGSFNMKMINTNVDVSTELENRNRNVNYVNTRAENAELKIQDSSDNQLVNESINNKYVQFLKRAIGNEILADSYRGLVECLKSETDSNFGLPSEIKSNFVINNKKSHMIVSFVNNRVWRDDQPNELRKVQTFALRQNHSGNGYKLMVKVVLAREPQWRSDILVQKTEQNVSIRDVNFRAREITATAIMEYAPQQNGANTFNVNSVNVKFEGLRFDIEKFSQMENSEQKLAMEVGKNLQEIIENGMAVALQQQLYQQQQVCTQQPMECNRCNQ